MKKCMLILMSVVASTALADETVYPVLTSTGSTKMNESFYNRALNWTSSDSSVTVVPPSDTGASAFDYELVTSLRGPTGNPNVYHSHKFTLKTSLQEARYSGTAVNTFENEGLVIAAKGSISVMGNRFCDTTYTGKITITAPDGDDRASFVSGNYDPDIGTSILRIAGTLIGDSTVGVKARSGQLGTRVVIEADASQYYGKLYFNGEDTHRTTFGNIVFNGSVIDWGGRIGTERATDVAQLNSLKFSNAKSKLYVVTDFEAQKAGLLVVTNVFEQTAKITVNHIGMLWKGRTPILKLTPTAKGTLNLDNFIYGGAVDIVGNADATATIPRDLHLEVDVEEDGSQVLSLVSERKVALLMKDDTSNNGSPLATDTSAITNATYWSNAADWPDSSTMYPDADYVTLGHRLRTEYVKEATFPGRSLTVKGATVVQMTKLWTINDCRMGPGAYVSLNYMWQLGNENGLFGNLATESITPDDHITFNVYFYQYYTLGALLTGNGNLKFNGSGGSAYPRGYVRVPGANPNFKGTWYVTITESANSDEARRAPTELNRERFYIGTGLSLGGALDAFNYKSLMLDNMSLLEAMNTLTLDEPTRGIYVEYFAGFGATNNITMTVKNPITLNGRLRKESAGTLELGGKLRFLDDTGALSDLPRANSNLLEIAEGAVKPVSTEAFDGLAISFADSGSTLSYDLVPTDASVATYGVYNVKNETNPFTPTSAGKIPVRFDGTPDRNVGVYELGVATLKTQALAEDVKSRLDVSRVIGRTVRPFVRENANGTFTVVCALEQKGFMVIVR